MIKRDWYCPGFGGRHIIPKAGRLFLSCSRCRWAPNYKDAPEQKDKILKLIGGAA